MFGTLSTPPARHGGREVRFSNNPMDMDSIRARRARLEDMIKNMRDSPLSRSASMSHSSLIKGPDNISFGVGSPQSSAPFQRYRRRSWDLGTKAPPTPGSPENHLALTPMTCRSFMQQPLPDIGRRKDSISPKPSPAVSRESSGKRRSAPPSAADERTPAENTLPAPEEKRPATGKSRDSDEPPSEKIKDDEDEDETEGPCSQDEIVEIVRGMGSNSQDKAWKSTMRARKLLSNENSPPVQEFLDAGILTPLMPLLQTKGNPALQHEATWTLTNLASGNSEQTGKVVDAGAIPILVELLNSDNVELQEQASWALGNIAGDGPHYRNMVMQAEVLKPLLNTLHVDSGGVSAQVSLTRVVTWVLANLFRHKGLSMTAEDRKSCLFVLQLLLDYKDSEVVVDALWAISYIADMDDESLGDVVSSGFVPTLVSHLNSGDRQKVVPALRAVGTLASGDDNQTEQVLESGALPILRDLLADSRRNIKKEAAWTLSNITAGNKSQIQKVIDANILPKLIQCVQCEYVDVQKEAAWAISNLTAGGTEEQMSRLIDDDGTQALVKLLAVGQTNIISVALQGLKNLLKYSDREDEVKDIIKKEGGRIKLENLQNHANMSIREKATEILKTIKDDDEDDDDYSGNDSDDERSKSADSVT